MELRVRWTQFVVALALGALSAQAAEIAVLRNGFGIRHERREVQDSSTRLYLNADQSGYVDVPTSDIERFDPDDAPPPSAATPATAPIPDIKKAVSAASDKHLIDADLIASVIRAESGFNHHAVSRKGAQGLMQLMPATASRLGVKDSFDADANVDGGTRYLRDLLLQYKGDVAKALAAYNAGPHRVEQYKGVPPYRETRSYVSRIIRDYNRKKLEERKHSASSAPSPASQRPSPGQ